MNTKRCIFCMEEISDMRSVCPHCGRGAWEYRWQPRWRKPLTVLGERYLLGIAVGEGAFGTAYLAWDSVGERRAAVKVCSGDCGEEARLLRKCGPLPGLVKLYDFFTEDGQSFLVTEYLSGGSLKAYVHEKKQGRLSIQELAALLWPVAEALVSMHSVGIVHCDVSPDNILLDENGGCRLIDLGAARQSRESGDTALDGEKRFLKTAYAAPEQYTEPGLIGPWTDVYGLCAMMYELLTGEKPAPAADRLRRDTLKPPSFYEAVSPETEQLLLRGLETEIQRRFFGVELVMAGLGFPMERVLPLGGAVRRYWGGLWLDISAGGRKSVYTGMKNTRKKRLRRRLLTGVLGTLCCGALCFGGVRLWRAAHPSEELQRRLQRARNAQVQSRDLELFTGKEPGYEESVRYLREHGEKKEFSNKDIEYYTLEEEKYLDWGLSGNRYRKLYLDWETLRDAAFYYTGAQKAWLEKEEYSFESDVSLWLTKPGQLRIYAKKTVSCRVNFPGETLPDTLKISYDPADGRGYSVECQTSDRKRAARALTGLLPVCCPETFLTEEEAEEILDECEETETAQLPELADNAWLCASAYETDGKYRYLITIAASKGCLW